MSTFIVNKRNLKREPSLTKAGQIACSLPPSLERDYAWPQKPTQEQDESPLQRSEEAPLSKNHSEESVRDMMFNLSIGSKDQESYVPTTFTEEQWKAAAKANPKPAPFLERKHGYNAKTTKNHSRGSITRLMRLIDVKGQSSKGMWSSVQSLQDVPESRELVAENIIDNLTPLPATNSSPKNDFSKDGSALSSLDGKLSPVRSTVTPFDGSLDLEPSAPGSLCDTSMLKPCLGKTSKKDSLMD